jgi:hypothetical protein
MCDRTYLTGLNLQPRKKRGCRGGATRHDNSPHRGTGEKPARGASGLTIEIASDEVSRLCARSDGSTPLRSACADGTEQWPTHPPLFTQTRQNAQAINGKLDTASDKTTTQKDIARDEGSTKLSASYLQAKSTFRDMPCSLDSAPLFLKCQPICVTEATEVDQKLLGVGCILKLIPIK